METEQFWKGQFGDTYTIRNSYDLDNVYKKTWGVTRTQLNKEFLKGFKRKIKLLEVGCNRGLQLENLQSLGFKNLYGIDINKKAIKIAQNKFKKVIEGSALELPYPDNNFDLVCTNGVLIHIHPENIIDVILELLRVSKKHILCWEYYNKTKEQITYRGYKNKLWKNDFQKIMTSINPSIKVVKSRKIPYIKGHNVNTMFLLEKVN